MRYLVCLLIAALIQSTVLGQSMEIQWQQCFGGTEQDIAFDIVEIPEGYLITGYTWSIDGDISFNNGLLDGWLIKTDLTGDIIWEKTYGGSSGDGFFRIIPDNSGNYFLVGGSASSDGDISYDPYPDSEDFWIVKIDINGNILWDKIIGGNKSDKIWTGSPTLDGGVVAVGYTYSNDGDVSVSYYGPDTWAVKISSEGEVEWDYTIGTDWIDKGQAILATSDGGYLISSNSIIPADAIGNITCTPHSTGFVEGVVFKLDSNLNILWQRCYGGSNHDGLFGMTEIEDGYVFTGSTSSTDGDVSGWHEGYDHLGNPESDIWVVKIDFNGNIIWQKCLGGSSDEGASIVLANSVGNFAVVGQTYSNDGDVSGHHSYEYLYPDIWFITLNTGGELLSQRCFGGLGREELQGGTVQKSDNNYVIAARTNWGPSYDVACTPHGGQYDEDWWVFEIKDCTGLYATTPARPIGPPGVCTSLTPQSMYFVHTTALAQTYEWSVYPSEAGTLTQQDTTLSITWAAGWEGAVSMRARAVNECGPSEWSVTHYANVHTCIGITELSQSGISLWPNPANDMLNIVLPASTQLPLLLTLSDLTGRVLLSQQLTQAQTAINLSSLPQDVFFCHFASKEINVTAKIIKAL
jgi:hypothetical protein